MKENILSVWIALLLASVIFFGLLLNFDSFESLQTNVIGAEQETLLGDLVVETYSDRIEIVANKNIDNVAATSIMLLRNPNEVIPNFDAMTSDWRSEITQEFGSRTTVFINWLEWLRKNDTLLSIPLDGDVSMISVSDGVLLFEDESSERASMSTITY